MIYLLALALRLKTVVRPEPPVRAPTSVLVAAWPNGNAPHWNPNRPLRGNRTGRAGWR